MTKSSRKSKTDKLAVSSSQSLLEHVLTQLYAVLRTSAFAAKDLLVLGELATARQKLLVPG